MAALMKIACNNPCIGYDQNQRNTWYTGKSGIADWGEQLIKQNSKKIPGLQALGDKLQTSDNETLQNIGNLIGNEPRINSKGEVMENKGGNLFGRAFNAVLPLEVGRDVSTETDNKLKELAKEFPTGDTRDSIFPYAKQSEAKFKTTSGEDVQLTPKQWTEYQQAKGQMSMELADQFVNSPEWNELDAASKQAVLSDAYSFSTKYTQNKIADGKNDKGSVRTGSNI